MIAENLYKRLRKWWRINTGNRFVTVSYNCCHCGRRGETEIEKKFTLKGKLHPLIKAYCGQDGCVEFEVEDG